jgi:hypothetical protein
MNSILSLFSLFVLTLNVVAREFSDAELLEIGRKALQDRANFIAPEKMKAEFHTALTGFSDDQRIKAVFYRALESEKDPKANMSNYYSVISMLSSDGEWVQDWSQLRKLLREEQDPRRFYILSKRVPFWKAGKRFDFVTERTHMLFADGRVSKNDGEYTPHYARDVSKYADHFITYNLKGLKADFEPPPKKMPHKEQAMILGKWLKGNWPGCEKIDIPDISIDEGARPRKSSTVELESKPPTKERVSPSAQTQASKKVGKQEGNSRVWIIAGVILVGIIFFLIKVRIPRTHIPHLLGAHFSLIKPAHPQNLWAVLGSGRSPN